MALTSSSNVNYKLIGHSNNINIEINHQEQVRNQHNKLVRNYRSAKKYVKNRLLFYIQND